MSSTREERVENALQQLLTRLVPQYPDEDEALADQRWNDANDFARDRLLQDAEPHVREDASHAADQIRSKLVQDYSSPEQATVFSNLYSRLLAQPVLSQKWAILYFLYLLSSDDNEQERRDLGVEMDGYGEQVASEAGWREHHSPRAFDEAFARNGLPRMSSAEPDDGPRTPPVRERAANAARPKQSVQQEPPAEEAGHRTNRDIDPSESALLRDLPFTLQGLSSNNLKFDTPNSLRIPSTLPVPLVSLLHTLAEPSLLYRSLAEFVDTTGGGLVGQSLRSAIEKELRSYLGLVATLEGQIRRALSQLESNQGNGGMGKAGVTLKRCVVWTREATLGLRLMSLIVESAKAKKGGELISLIHNFSSSHGDPFVHTFAERLLASMTRPFYSMLSAWIYNGELEDPYLEFFVQENLEYEDSGATSGWEHKYLLKQSMIPSIITFDFANRVFLIGKSLNFIRHSCGDSAWVENYSKEASRELRYGDIADLGSTIDEAYKSVMARLITLMENKFALYSHLQALKSYLLLGQGDFIALLMESLASNLDRPANSQYRHTLTAQLEHAIRNSNAQHDSADVLRRLDARMLELSHGEIGWDVFTLEYRVDSPLDVIVTPWASKQYLKVFNFLWRVKRVEFALSTTWRRVQTGARGVLSAVSDRFGDDWKQARAGLAEMVHFVNQLQYYILFEVIEAGWEGLMKSMRKPDATLDTLISSHTAYLRSITRKGLLGGGGGIDFTAQLHELLKLMLAYRDAVDSLYSYSVAEFTRRQDLAAKIETRTKAGRWGLTEADDDSSVASPHTFGAESPLPPVLLPSNESHERTLVDQLRSRLKSLEADFRARVNVLLGDLAYQPDVDMRFLGVVMNFNEVYSPVRKRRHRAGDKGGNEGTTATTTTTTTNNALGN